MLAQSRDVIQTNGEWELADIQVGDVTLALNVGSYSQIKYFVSPFHFFSLSFITDFELQ